MLMMIYRLTGFWVRFDKIVNGFGILNTISDKLSIRSRPGSSTQGLQNIFRLIFTANVGVILLLLILKMFFFAIDVKDYNNIIEIVLDITVAVITPLSLLYLHGVFKIYITRQGQEYKTLFKENPQAMWVYDIHTLKFLMVNDAAVALYGYTADEFLRMRISDIRPLEDIPAFLDEDENRNSSSLPHYHWSGTWRHKTKSGKALYAEVSSYEMVFNGKQAALALSYNVTDKMIQELKLVTVNQELEQKVRDRTNDLLLSNQTLISQNKAIKKANQDLARVTEELKVANEKLKEHAELKNQFVSLVSHEFRSPLATIRFAAEFIHRHHDKLTKEKIKEKTAQISKTIDHMDLLLADVLTIQRSESPKIKASIEKVDIKAFIHGITNEVLLATKNTHQIDIDINVLCEKFGSDEKLLRNIFLNLLTNAIKYSGDSKAILFTASSQPAAIRFDITDYGMGISSEYIEHIFEPFYRTPRVKDIQGTGLGLSIVKRAIDAMGGEITVKSEVGKGSTFTVTLPVN